jgi:hypothetical protein
VVTIPLTGLFLTLWLILPVSESLLLFAAAPLIGVPLVFLFNMKGLNPVIALSGLSVIWPLGDCLPPTAVIGKTAVMTVEYQGPYYRGVVRECVVPLLVIALTGMVYVVFSKSLGFLAVF